MVIAYMATGLCADRALLALCIVFSLSLSLDHVFTTTAIKAVSVCSVSGACLYASSRRPPPPH